ncbi:MAG: cobyrinic acid ac-diamide synthase [Candidatus Latescibacterota bacterium]|nr:MAG: cobyrinic acid ac-diamide synthase [Candidatus Latescibacterota bacterium]
MKIAISSGKGGTGKTFVATNIAATLRRKGKDVCYLDCDVEEPNGHLFLKPVILEEDVVEILAPVGIDEERCVKCGRCAEVCHYNAIAVVRNAVLFFPALCHVCGACMIVCPKEAIIERKKKIGVLRHGRSGQIDVHYALLETGQGGMSPRLVRKVKERASEGINILDSPPGTACPVVETVKGADLVVLVTDPTPFGVHDLRLSVNMCRQIGQEPVVVVNRAKYRDDALKKYCAHAGLEILGEIPEDRKIAEVYSVGDLVVEKLPQYRQLFELLADRMEEAASEQRTVKPIGERPSAGTLTKGRGLQRAEMSTGARQRPRELVIISGKGGTGKTSIAGAFAALAGNAVVSDCDVDASDLHLLLQPQVMESGDFSGGVIAEIDQAKCTQCGRCKEACRFEAIQRIEVDGKIQYQIDAIACEGCGVCALVCEVGAVKTEDAINGQWFVSETRFGPMTHAELGVAEENSGRLVTLVRDKATHIASDRAEGMVIIDGAPGTGCPVISSLTGADYALIITEPTVSGIHDMRRILDVTRHFGIPAGVVVNKYDLNTDMTKQIKAVAREYNAQFIGTIPYDTKITEAQMEGLSVVEYTNGRVAECIKQIWVKISQRG